MTLPYRPGVFQILLLSIVPGVVFYYMLETIWAAVLCLPFVFFLIKIRVRSRDPCVIAERKRKIQEKRNKVAKSIFNKIRSERYVFSFFFLYLRPFEADSTLENVPLERDFRDAPWDMVKDIIESPEFEKYNELDYLASMDSARMKAAEEVGQDLMYEKQFSSLIANICAPFPTVALRGPELLEGPGLVESEPECWKKNIEMLCKRADVILFVAGASDGLLWELTMIKEKEYLQKTLFIIPPTDHSILAFQNVERKFNEVGIHSAFYCNEREKEILGSDYIPVLGYGNKGEIEEVQGTIFIVEENDGQFIISKGASINIIQGYLCTSAMNEIPITSRNLMEMARGDGYFPNDYKSIVRSIDGCGIHYQYEAGKVMRTPVDLSEAESDLDHVHGVQPIGSRQ